MKDKPTIIAKIKGDARKYTIWGIDWLNHKILVERACGYEQISFDKITILESELSSLRRQRRKRKCQIAILREQQKDFFLLRKLLRLILMKIIITDLRYGE